MTDWNAVLRQIAPQAKSDVLAVVAPYLDEIFDKYEINTALRAAHFLGQAAHESDGFRTLVEYGSDAYFKRYDGRKDLGNTHKGDGARYKGRCPFQLTGRANYKRVGTELGIDLVNDPDLAIQGQNCDEICGVYWRDHNLNALADKDDIKAITRAINGGYNGLADRQLYTDRAKKALKPNDQPVLPLVGNDSAGDPPVQEPLSRERVKAVQQKLADLGYHLVGQIDGIVGGNTIAAVSAFQFEHQMAVTGQIDDATEKAILADTEQRPVPTARAASLPEHSRILRNAKALMASAGGLGTAGAASLANSTLSQAEAVKSYYDRTTALLQPLEPLQHHLFSGPVLSAITIFLAGGLGFLAWKICHYRIEDHQTGKTA